MKKTIAILLFFLPFVSLGQGMKIDQASYERMPLINLGDNSRVGTKSTKSDAKLSVDLRPFVPEIVHQGQGNNTCVSISTAYYAAGTRQAYLRQVAVNPTQFALSPLYHIIRNHSTCSDFQNINFVVEDLENNGGVSYSTFPDLVCRANAVNFSPSFRAVNQQRLCGNYKDENGIERNVDCKGDEIVYNIKLALTNGYPVVTGLPVGSLADYNFRRLKYYRQTNNLSNIGHAITIVGYDIDRELQQTYFIIANSWGSEWGDNGYFYMLADDLRKTMMSAAFIFNVVPINTTPNSPQRTTEQANGLGTSFELQNIYDRIEGLSYVGQGLYRANQNYKLGDQFYGVIKNLSPDMYLYVLSQDASDFKVAKHWPREIKSAGSKIDDVIVVKGTPILFPEPDYPLEITGGVQDHIIILASKKDLSADLPYIIRNLENNPNRNANISERLNIVLSGRMIATNNIDYRTDSAKGTLRNLNASGDILPLIIEINHR